MSGLVSIVIPSYNRAFCVCAAIDSVLAQTYRNLEAIVVDDGSKDNTRDVIQAKYEHEPRVRYLYQVNGGVAAARNAGFAQAQGDYLALLDSDDIWRPWKLEMQVRCLQTFPLAGMIWSEMEAVDPAGKLVQARYLRTMYGAYRWFTSDQLFVDKRLLREVMPGVPSEHQEAHVYAGDIFSPMVMGNMVHTSTTLLTRERFSKVRGFNEALTPVGEDYDFHLRTCREGPVAFVDVPTIQYQLGYEDRLTKLTYLFAVSFLKTLKETLAKDKDRITLPAWMLTQVQAESNSWVAEELLNRGDRSAAAGHFWESLRHKRWQPRVFMQWLRCKLPTFLDRALLGAYHLVKPGKSQGNGS